MNYPNSHPSTATAALDDPLVSAAAAASAHIVFAEGDDARIRQAAEIITEAKMARVTLLTADKTHGAGAATDTSGALTIVNPSRDPRLEKLAQALYERRRHKGMSREQSAQQAVMPLNFAHLLVAEGYADGAVAGAVHSTSATIRSSLQIIGAARDSGGASGVVSSFFLMRFGGNEEVPAASFIFADCALIPQPDERELAEIAVASASSARLFLQQQPRIAMLSFSSAGSAQHPQVELVQGAAELARQRLPDVPISNDLQFDAALMPAIAAIKAPQCEVAGRANVFVFPNLAAGNIGYKIAQRLGGAIAIGPVMQGLALPANDLSRGCSVSDIIRTAAITALQSRG